MFTLDMHVSGNKRESVKLRRFKGALPQNLMRGIDKATLILERQIKKELSRGGSFRRLKGQPWVPNPGRHLRVGDGTLRASWKHKPARRKGNDVEGHVTSPVVYSAIHEFGGMAGNGVRIPERPYVKPSLDAVRDKMQEVIAKEITKPLRGPA